MPSPVGIQINQCARMSLMLRRAPAAGWLSEKWQEEMRKIESCLHCNQCAAKCPYGLDTPRLLQDNYRDYWTHLERGYPAARGPLQVRGRLFAPRSHISRRCAA